jgi:hypothetical protein
MGSYNVSCSISRISINAGTKIAYIPLERNKYPYEIGDGNDNLIYKHCFYNPATLPIFGQYDDYGGVENIQRDQNVSAIENYFDKKIEDIIGIDGKEKSISSGMFIHYEIYKHLITSIINDDGKRKGFGVVDRKELSQELKNYRSSLGKNIVKSKENTSEMQELLKNRELNEFIDNEWNTPIKRAIESYKESADKFWNGLFVKSSLFQFRDYDVFNKIYQSEILAERLKEELIDFVVLEWGMFAVNVFYFPSMNGWQFGNKYASRNFYRKCHQIMVQDIKEEKKNIF